MSRCTNDTYSKYAITSADQIKNVPVDLTNLGTGYSLVYENNKFVLKDVQGGGSGSGITIADVLAVIKQGTGIAIDRETGNEITISSDTTQYIKTNTTVGTATLIKPIQIIEFYDTTRQMLQNFNTGNKENTMVLIVNNSSYNINISSLGVLVDPDSASLFIKAVDFMQVLTIKNYDTKISSIEGSIENLNSLLSKCLTNNSAIYELSDVPNYDVAEDGSALTKTAKGLEWRKGIGVKDVTDNIKEGTNITITREDTGAITINSIGGGTGGVTKQEVLDSILAGDNVTINRDTQGQITVSATGGSGGGSTDGIYVVRSEKFKLTQGNFTTPYQFKQTGGNTHVTLSAPSIAGSESVINYYSNDDIEIYGVLQARFSDLSAYPSNSISDAFRVGIGLPVLPSIQVTKKYPRSIAGISVGGYCVTGVTANTFTISGTSSSVGNYVYVNFSYNLEGGNALVKTYSNTNKLVYFRAYLKAEDITLRDFEITEAESHMLDYYYDEKENKWVKDELWQQRLEMNYIKD